MGYRQILDVEKGQALPEGLCFMVLLDAQPLTGMDVSQPAFQCTSNFIGTEEIGGTHIEPAALRFTAPAAASHCVRGACSGHSLRHLVPSARACDPAWHHAAGRHSVLGAAPAPDPAPPAGGSRRAAVLLPRIPDPLPRRAYASPVRRSRPSDPCRRTPRF